MNSVQRPWSLCEPPHPHPHPHPNPHPNPDPGPGPDPDPKPHPPPRLDQVREPRGGREHLHVPLGDDARQHAAGGSPQGGHHRRLRAHLMWHRGRRRPHRLSEAVARRALGLSPPGAPPLAAPGYARGPSSTAGLTLRWGAEPALLHLSACGVAVRALFRLYIYMRTRGSHHLLFPVVTDKWQCRVFAQVPLGLRPHGPRPHTCSCVCEGPQPVAGRCLYTHAKYTKPYRQS